MNSIRLGLRDCLVCMLGKHWGFARVDNQPEPDKFLNKNFPGESFTFMHCLRRLRCLGVASSGSWPAGFSAWQGRRRPRHGGDWHEQIVARKRGWRFNGCVGLGAEF